MNDDGPSSKVSAIRLRPDGPLRTLVVRDRYRHPVAAGDDAAAVRTVRGSDGGVVEPASAVITITAASRSATAATASGSDQARRHAHSVARRSLPHARFCDNVTRRCPRPTTSC